MIAGQTGYSSFGSTEGSAKFAASRVTVVGVLLVPGDLNGM